MLPGIKLFSLAGQTAIVTGGSKGLGLAIAEGLASAGANVALVSRTPAEGEASRIAREYTVRAISLSADVSDEAAVTRMVRETMEQLGSVDVLVNNAGINTRGPISTLTLAEFQKVQQINVDGVWLCSRAVVPHMKSLRRGRIINLASAIGLVGLADRTPYCASKGAVIQMTRALALELAVDNITVNAIAPGPFLTDMNMPVKDEPSFQKFILDSIALGRWGELHEIQGAALYLASAAGGYSTGSVLTVDGGWTAR